MSNLSSSKITSVYTKLFFVILYITAITLFDSFAYGIVYQQKIKKENYNNRLASWVFRESATPDKEESKSARVHDSSGMRYSAAEKDVTVPNYRVIQKIIEISGILLIFYYFGLWPAIGLVISHYLLTYDLLYYIVLNQTHSLRNLGQLINPYWLQNWYQAGYFILKPFNTLYFYISGIGGLIIAVIFCCIPFKGKY